MLFAEVEGRPGEKSRLEPGARQRRHLQYKRLRRRRPELKLPIEVFIPHGAGACPSQGSRTNSAAPQSSAWTSSAKFDTRSVPGCRCLGCRGRSR
jgi:hypothetical protein